MIHFIFLIIIFCSCGAQKPVTTTHTERIEQHLMPIPVSADTIEITLYQTLEKQRGPDTPDERSDPQYKTSTASQNNSSFRSTRPISLQTHHTDTSTRIKLTLRPDTVFLPYTHHIRSDTIVVPDRICNEKLKQTKFMNVILLIFLILFVATIIYRKIFHK